YSAKQECFALALKIVRKPLLYLFHSRLGLAVDHSRDDLIHHLGPECRGISILELETVRLKRRTASACNVKNTGPQCGLRISRNSAVPAQYSFTMESDNELYFAMTIDDYDR